MRGKSFCISNRREAGTGVAVVKRRDTKEGMRVELSEIDSYLKNTDIMPLNKTEYERLRKRKKRIIRILEGRDARWSILGGRQGPPKENEVVPYSIKRVSMGILDMVTASHRLGIKKEE